jgi:hypothetical protein
VTRTELVDAALQFVAAVVGFLVTFALMSLALRHLWPLHHDESDIGFGIVSWGLSAFTALLGAFLAGRAARAITRRRRGGVSQ